jgi:crotonobetainyl-CoA:carnitine CoA-transferase CaiB-like acyl-CoA transferase
MRHYTSDGPPPEGEAGVLFQFLNASKRSVVGGPDDPAVQRLIAGADLVIESFPPGAFEARALAQRQPALVVLSISPFGRSGPWSDRPATEFTLQAESGSIGSRGLPGQEPFQAAGRITDWVAGTYASVAALAAVRCARASGRGEYIDFSLLEGINIAGSNYLDLIYSLLGRPDVAGSVQSVETPSIEPTRDGYVGFCTNTAQQFSDFLLLIGRPDLREDRELFLVQNRVARLDEWQAIVHAYTRAHTTAEIIEQATLLRIPVAPVNDGRAVFEHEQLRARGVFESDPTGRFQRPRPPYRIGGESPPPPRPAPRLGEHTGSVEPRVRTVPVPHGERALPLAGLRILDLTAWWAGPSATHMLACLGADVIHVEAVQRLDGMRMMGGVFQGRERWWEYSAFFLAANSNKRGLTLDLTTTRGRELLLRLVAVSDAVVENFTPRVMRNLGLGREVIAATNPRALFVRMPAFGLDGPWRDNTGFAQTMEQLTGLAWLTGHAADQPRIQRGPCDPLAGMHAAFGLLVALAERDRTGCGAEVECTMVEGALNAAAEQALEWSAYGRVMAREGNRCPTAAPQGLYPCRGHDPVAAPRWLALSVADDAQWAALARVLGDPAWARADDLATHAGRRAAHDRVDVRLREWAAERDLEDTVALLCAAGVPAARVADPRATGRNPQLADRGFYERVDHPVVGAHATPTLPFRYASVDRWLTSAAPSLGQHNHEILADLVGLSDTEIDDLREAGVIGELPASS